MATQTIENFNTSTLKHLLVLKEEGKEQQMSF